MPDAVSSIVGRQDFGPREANVSRSDLKAVHKRFQDSGLAVDYYSQEDGDLILLPVDQADCVIEVTESGKLSCQFGIDMQELRTLVSGPGNEDIAEDELQRVARDHLRPFSRKFGPGLRELGFEETVDTAAEHYAISFEKPVDLGDPEAVRSELQSCLSLIS